MTTTPKPQPPLFKLILALIFVTVAPPILLGYSLFNPPKLGFRLVEANLVILLLFVMYLGIGVGIFRTRRINVAQCIIFAVLSVSFLLNLLLSFAFVFRILGLLDRDGHRTFDPLSCLYFSAITWTTVGYGDLSPSPEARLYAASEALLAYVFMAMLIAGFLHLLARFRSDHKAA
jgi:Ion channel